VAQNPGTGPCPSVPLVPGQSADYGALLVVLQPGPDSGSTCDLIAGGTLVGDELIIGLYTPNALPNDSVPISVMEFTTATVTVTSPGPNNTTVSTQVVEDRNVVYSNTTVGAAPGQIQEFELDVPPVPGTEDLTIGLLGANLTVSIVVPGAGIAIPANYPQLLLHDFLFQVYVVVFFVFGIGIATMIRLRARHVERLWPFGAVGVLAAIGFAGYAYGDYPASLIPLGSLPEAVVATPVVLAGMYLWLTLFPTEARIHKIEFPVADVRDGESLYDERRFRLFPGPDGPEYIGRGGAGATLRFLGVRTKWKPNVLTQAPRIRRFRQFRSVRYDTYGKFFAYAELPAGEKVLTVVPPRVFVLPWRRRTRERVEAYYRSTLRGSEPVPDHLGLLLHITPSCAFAAVASTQGAVLIEAWINGTLHHSRVGLALERVLVAYTELKVTYKARAWDYGQKIALALSMGERFPDSPVALAALEDLATRQEAEIMDEKAWYDYLKTSVDGDGGRRPARVVPGTEELMREALDPRPPELRGKRGPVPGGNA
jgi:hypothetical protein